MIYLLLAPGFEEIEALTPLDLCRRAGLSVTTVAIAPADGRAVTGSHGITVMADLSQKEFTASYTHETPIEALILPGGMPGTSHLNASSLVSTLIANADDQNALLCAICAAPMVLGRRAMLYGKRATCFPGFEEHLIGATLTGEKVIRDGRIITAAGMGVAQEFGLEIVAALTSEETAASIRASIQSL